MLDKSNLIFVLNLGVFIAIVRCGNAKFSGHQFGIWMNAVEPKIMSLSRLLLDSYYFNYSD